MGAAGVAAGAQAGGAVIGGYGAYQQGLAQDRYYKYMAGNARVAADTAIKEGDRESADVQDAGLIQTQNLGRKVAQTEGAQTAALAANGTAGTVTGADIATDTMRNAQLDRMAIRYEADRKSWAAKQNAANRAWQLNVQANEDETAGRAAKQSGKLGLYTSLLGGATSVANTWSRAKMTAPSQATGRSSLINGGRPFPVSSGEY